MNYTQDAIICLIGGFILGAILIYLLDKKLFQTQVEQFMNEFELLKQDHAERLHSEWKKITDEKKKFKTNSGEWVYAVKYNEILDNRKSQSSAIFLWDDEYQDTPANKKSLKDRLETVLAKDIHRIASIPVPINQADALDLRNPKLQNSFFGNNQENNNTYSFNQQMEPAYAG